MRPIRITCLHREAHALHAAAKRLRAAGHNATLTLLEIDAQLKALTPRPRLEVRK